MAGSRRLSSLAEEASAGVERTAPPRRPMLVALSGGADSAVLAWAALRAGRECRAAHVHHGWPASDRMERAAAAVAARLGLELEFRRVEAGGPGSPEESARAERYRALGEMRRPSESVATGHTRTDQAETVLGNLMWGTGLDGLRGIRRRRGWLVRPLLDMSRSRTRELAELLSLPFVDDPANEEQRYRRVRIRSAMAAWEGSLSADLTNRLADLAETAAPDIDFLEEAAGAAPVESDGRAVRMPLGALRTLPEALVARAVRRGLRETGGGYPGTRRDVASVLAAARGGPAAELSGGRRAERRGAYLTISPPGEEGERVPPPAVWGWEGTVRWGEWTWRARRRCGAVRAFPLSPWRQFFSLRCPEDGPAFIRALAADDRLAAGFGHKTARDALSEAGVPAPLRSRWPVLEAGGRAVWVPGARRADYGWVGEGDDGFLEVRAVREEEWKSAGF